jgi:hypothetical protein
LFIIPKCIVIFVLFRRKSSPVWLEEAREIQQSYNMGVSSREGMLSERFPFAKLNVNQTVVARDLK